MSDRNPSSQSKKEELSSRGIWTDRDVCACSLRTENFSCPAVPTPIPRRILTRFRPISRGGVLRPVLN